MYKPIIINKKTDNVGEKIFCNGYRLACELWTVRENLIIGKLETILGEIDAEIYTCPGPNIGKKGCVKRIENLLKEIKDDK